MQTELLDLLAARNGHFKLESGHHGNLWLDLDRLFLRPREVRRFALQLADQLAPYHVQAIGGPLIGGALIAQIIAAELDVAFYYTERFVPQSSTALYSVEYRLPETLRRSLNGKTIAIVDDVINAGSAVRGTYAALQAAGASPLVIGALLVLGTKGADHFTSRGVPVVSVAQRSNDIWEPDHCPLCAAGVALSTIT